VIQFTSDRRHKSRDGRPAIEAFTPTMPSPIQGRITGFMAGTKALNGFRN